MKGYDSDLIHFLHVARLYKPVLNYKQINTNGLQRLSYIHASTKYKKTHCGVAVNYESKICFRHRLVFLPVIILYFCSCQ